MKNLIAIALVSGLAASANAQVDLANWTFETSIPTTAGPHTAEGGIFAAASLASASHASSVTVYSNPVGNGSFESFSSNNWSIGDFYQFTTSASGYENITFSWMQTRSSTGPGTFDLELSINGGAFSTLVDDYAVLAVNWSSVTADPTTAFPALSLPAAANDAATLTFRLVNQVTPGGTAGSNRVDNIVVQGTLIPAPGAVALLGLGGLLAARRRRA